MADDTNKERNELIRQGICPRCKNRLSHEEGCLECLFCGWSLCAEA